MHKQPCQAGRCHEIQAGTSEAALLANAENCIVLAEGRMQNNKVLKVQALGFPPLESRADTASAAKVTSSYHQASHI